MASVTYDHATKHFGDVVAIEDLSIHIEDKEFLVLLGPSGCGKTTALRLLAGLEELTAGNVMIGDRVVNDLPPKDRNIAMVFQSYALYPHMSVYDNMAFGLKLRKTPKAEIDRRVKEAARILQIEELLNRRPKELSGGQRQRVAVGRAIVRKPHVFLMDEPLSNLDAKLRASARAELTKLHHRLEATFIYVTHDQIEAMTMANRIALLKDGVLQQFDTPQNLYAKPVNVFVGGFIGSPAMNFFNINLVSEDGELYLDGGTFKLLVPPERRDALANYTGKPVILGIRPEDIHDGQFAPPLRSTGKIPARVEVTELMGNEIFVYAVTGDQNLTARVDPRTSARVGAEIELVANLENMHIFDATTQLAIR